MNHENLLATDKHGYALMNIRQTTDSAHNGNDMMIIRDSSVFICGSVNSGVTA